jgi:hypothetical protein
MNIDEARELSKPGRLVKYGPRLIDNQELLETSRAIGFVDAYDQQQVIINALLDWIKPTTLEEVITYYIR